MKATIRSLLVLSVFAVMLAACGTTPATDVEPTPPPSSVPSAPAPSEAPDETPTATPSASPEPVGTLTVADGVAISGPGAPLSEVLAGDLSQPVLIRGTLFMTTEGELLFAESLEDRSVPTFGELRVRVENYPTDGPTWDTADADVTGLQEANGVLFFEDTRLFGTISE